MANEAKGAEIARAYVLVIPSTQGAQKTLTEELVPQAEKASEEAGHKSGTAFCSKMAKGIAAGAAAVAAAATTLVAGVVSAAQDVAALGDTIDKQSQKVGLTYEAYQKWDYVMQLAGTSMQACTTGLKTLTNKFDDAIQGGTGATETFARLGISMEEIQGLSRQDVFAKVVKALQNVTDETKKAALANDLFGKSGQDLLPLFNMTNDELDELMAETEAYGMIMSDEAVKDAAAFTDSMTKLEKTMQGLKTSMVSEFLPGLTLIADGLAGMAAGVDGASEQVAAGVTAIVKKMGEMTPRLIKLVGDLIPQVGQAILENIPALIDAVVQTIESLVDFIANDENLQRFIDAAVSIVMALVNAVPRLLNALAPAIPKIIESLIGTIIDHIPDFIQAALDIVAAIVDNADKIIVGILDALPGLIEKLFNTLTDPQNIGKMVDAGISLGKAIVEGMISAIASSKSAIGATLGFDANVIGGAMGVDPNLIGTGGSSTTNIYTGDVSVNASNASNFASSLRAASALG